MWSVGWFKVQLSVIRFFSIVIRPGLMITCRQVLLENCKLLSHRKLPCVHILQRFSHQLSRSVLVHCIRVWSRIAALVIVIIIGWSPSRMRGNGVTCVNNGRKWKLQGFLTNRNLQQPLPSPFLKSQLHLTCNTRHHVDLFSRVTESLNTMAKFVLDNKQQLSSVFGFLSF